MQKTCNSYEAAIQKHFEEDFSSVSLKEQVEFCENHDLLPIFNSYLKYNQPVLEAGCGSGKWLHFFKKNAIEAIGIDWDKNLRDFSQKFDPYVQFDVGDIRKLPYPDNYFGSVISMGSIEHVIEGPNGPLKEIYRVMKNNGVAIITVPFNSLIRKITFNIAQEVKNMYLVRKILNKTIINKNALTKIRKQRYRNDIYIETMNPNGKVTFYEYQFNRKQFQEELEKACFKIKSIKGSFLKDGIVQNFGFLAGRYDGKNNIKLTVLGKILRKILSAENTGHMLCAVVYK